jgi:hypothetical protein
VGLTACAETLKNRVRRDSENPEKSLGAGKEIENNGCLSARGTLYTWKFYQTAQFRSNNRNRVRRDFYKSLGAGEVMLPTVFFFKSLVGKERVANGEEDERVEEEAELGGDATLDGGHAEDGLGQSVVDELEGRGGCNDDEEECGEERGLEVCRDHYCIMQEKNLHEIK